MLSTCVHLELHRKVSATIGATTTFTMLEINSDLLPVGGDDAYIFGCNLSHTLLALTLQQFAHVVHEHLHFCYIEERRATGLTFVFTCHPVEDHWEALKDKTTLHFSCFAFLNQSHCNSAPKSSRRLDVLIIFICLKKNVTLFGRCSHPQYKFRAYSSAQACSSSS